MHILGVRLKKAGKIYFYETDVAEKITRGDFVVVETTQGLECLEVVVGARELRSDETPQTEIGLPFRKIYRKATESDLDQLQKNHLEEKRAFDICFEKIAHHEIPMKLIDVEFTLDVSKIIFYFTADGRVDFRELVKDLAATFRTRIELRQVGVRDQAKQIGGFGVCGRPLCCATFLGEFVPVSIRMAKDQNLSLNSSKISGLCGRLMCCINYEHDFYCERCQEQSNINFQPSPGERVVVADGEGKVIKVNTSLKKATILLDSNKTVVVTWDDILPADAEEIKPLELPKEDPPSAEPSPLKEQSNSESTKRPARKKQIKKSKQTPVGKDDKKPSVKKSRRSR